MKVRALRSVRCQGKRGQMVQLVPGDTEDLPPDIAQALIKSGDAVGVREHETNVQPPPETKVEVSEAVDATDAARELAEKEDVDLSGVEGTGADGRVLKSDVEDAG